jgi:Fur family ferric uptake transcriptional regulator
LFATNGKKLLPMREDMVTTSKIEELCIEKGMRMTGQRKVIGQVICEANDHPDVEEVYNRAALIDDKISIATVYRTVRMFEEAGIVEKHDFGDGRARYELADGVHHDHLIDVRSGQVIEFVDEEIERLQHEIAKKHGYKLVDHRLELFVVPIDE